MSHGDAPLLEAQPASAPAAAAHQGHAPTPALHRARHPQFLMLPEEGKVFARSLSPHQQKNLQKYFSRGSSCLRRQRLPTTSLHAALGPTRTDTEKPEKLLGWSHPLFKSSLGHVQDDVQGSEHSGSAARAAPPAQLPVQLHSHPWKLWW